MSERVSKLQDFGITSERRELEMKQRINDLEGDLANEKNAVARLAEENENLIKDKDKLVKEKEKIAQENEDSDKMRKSELMLSPRSTDAQVLRARFREAHDALRSKDEEIDELHKLLFELRPKLEREVEGQVKGIMEQAEHDAGRIRLEAQRLRDAHANRVDWQDQEIEQCRREIQVLSAAALHRDELIEKLRQVECEKEELAKRLDALVGEPQGETDTRDAPVLLASIAWRLAAIMAIVAASLALLSCSSGLPPRRAVPSASAEASCRGKFWWWAGAEQSTSAASSASDVSLGSARDSGFCRTLTSGVSKVFGVLPESQRHLAHAGGLVFMGVAVGATMTILASTLR